MKLLAYQGEVSRKWKNFGLLLLLWRRQAGKTTLFAWIALRVMMEFPGILVTFVSASMSVGQEMTAKVAAVFWDILAEITRLAESQGLLVESNADGLTQDDFMELFESGKLVIKIWHSNTVCSRLKVIAPNPATARGYTGFVLLDEIGWIPGFIDIWDAVEWIAARDPSFRILMATTPPADDTHYSYELAIHQTNEEFIPNARGNWYVSQAGVQVHRVDVWDAYKAGVKIYNTRTREPETPEVSRANAIDKESWDRNMALKFISGGAAACSLMMLNAAQQAGALQGVAAIDDFPANWRDYLGGGPITIGLDPATTEKEKSNPTGLTVLEKVGSEYVGRLIMRYKTASSEKAMNMIKEVCDLKKNRKPRRLVIDATNERYFADTVRRELAGKVPVELVVASEKHPFEEMSMKNYLGNILVNALEEGRIPLPADRWVRDDFRLVYKEKGNFVNHMDSSGNHGDTFDSTKLALHGFESGGPVEIENVNIGSLPTSFTRSYAGYGLTL